MNNGKKETSVASMLQDPSTWPTPSHTSQENFSSPRPTPATRKDRVAARPLPLAASLSRTSAEGGCADPACGKEKASSVIHDFVEVVLESQLLRLQQPYEPDPHMTSVVSYPQRCNLWGEAGFRGNCDGTLFKELVLRYQPRSVADPMMGSGTTRDVINGLNKHKGVNIRYWGTDRAEGFNAAMRSLPGPFDLVWVHPPYWNIIPYTEALSDLSRAATYSEYQKDLLAALRNCYHALHPRGRLAVLVGDIRRSGRYIPIVRDVLNWEGQLGALRSIIIKAQHNVRSDAKKYPPMEDVRIQHEYCVVFQKTSAAPIDPPDVIGATSEEGSR